MDYKPNEVDSTDRFMSIATSLILLAYGGYGIYVNDLYIPGKRSKGIHLHDTPALVMYGAFICACLVLTSLVIDHYDRRNNEHKYQAFASIFKALGWGLFIASIVANFALFSGQGWSK